MVALLLAAGAARTGARSWKRMTRLNMGLRNMLAVSRCRAIGGMFGTAELCCADVLASK